MNQESSQERLERWLREVVETYSPTWAEQSVLEVFGEILDEARLPYRKQMVDEERYNLIVELGPQPASLVWVGHVDTVALYDEEHRHPRVEDGIMWGLGSADMKSGCVAAIEGMRRLRELRRPLETGVTLALVVGEEEYGDGAEVLIQELKDSGVLHPWVVIGEPTDLKLCLSHFGYYECFLTTRGARAHAALPEVGDNAIHAMLAWMTRILEAQRKMEWGGDVALTPRKIDGGSPLFAVAESCEAVLDIHLPPNVEFEKVEALLNATLADTKADHGGCQLEFEIAFASPGFAASELPESLARAYRDTFSDLEPSSFRSHSDAAMFHSAGMPTVVVGPGRLEVAHTPDEHVELRQVELAAELYAQMFANAGNGGLPQR